MTRLAQLRLFADCDPAELEAAEALLTEVTVPAGHPVLTEGSIGRQFVVVAAGRVVVVRHGEPVGCLGPGDFAGELAMIEGGRRTASVHALSDVTLYAAGVRDFNALLRLPTIGPKLRRAAAERTVAGDVLVPTAPTNAPDVRTPVVALAPTRRIRVRDRWIGVALFALVALALGTLWVLDQRTKTTPFNLDDALTELHETESPAPAPGTTAASAGDSVDASSTASGAQGTTVTGPASDPARRSIGAAATGAPGTGMTLPATGVYTYTTTGGEKISMLGGKHDYPSQTHSIITHTGGCGWNIEHRIIEEHVDHYGRCSTGGTFQLLELSREIEFFSQRDGIDYMCEAPFEWVTVGDVVGSSHHATCFSDNNDGLDMTLKVTARGTRTIGGTTVPTLSYTAEWKMTGKATGWARTEAIVDAATGLLLHEHRIVDTDANAVFGDVHYDEDVVFDLVSLTPAN
jgi:hypothetical protein